MTITKGRRLKNNRRTKIIFWLFDRVQDLGQWILRRAEEEDE